MTSKHSDANIEEEDERYLSAGKILKITGKKDAVDVMKLNGFALNISSICRLDAFINLNIISLSLNSISSLEPCSVCLSLEEIYLRKNNVARLTEIRFLRNLTKLQSLFLADNPCCTSPYYRTKTLRILHSLVKLDDRNVDQNEREHVASADDIEITRFESEVEELMQLISKSSSDKISEEKLENLSKQTSYSEASAEPKHSVGIEDDNKATHRTNTLEAIRLLMLNLDPVDISQIKNWCAQILDRNSTC